MEASLAVTLKSIVD